MSTRVKSEKPATASNASLSKSDGTQGTRLATPLSSHMAGARRRAGGDGDGGIAVWNIPTTTTTTICRTTDTGRLEKPTIASTLRAASNRSKVLAQKAASNKKAKQPIAGIGVKKCTDKYQINSTSKQTERQWPLRKSAGGTPVQKKNKLLDTQNEGEFKQQSVPGVVSMLETGVQTNEAEILNRELVVGDIKLLMPSQQVADEIDRRRLAIKNKLDRPIMRKFAAYEQDEEQHLDELKEFSERNYVTKRKPKQPPSFEVTHSKNAFKSMDEIFSREIPKSESITNIKERIKRKEQELMSMFDDVDVDEKVESEFEGD